MRSHRPSGGRSLLTASIAATSRCCGDLGPGPGVGCEVGLDLAALVLVDGVEGVGAEQLLDRLRRSSTHHLPS